MVSTEELEFTQYFRNCRRTRYKNQSSLAQAAQVNRATVSRTENGQVPGPDAFYKMLKALKKANHSQSDLEELEQLWHKARDGSGIRSEPSAFEHFLQDLATDYETMPEREVFQEELEKIADLWNRYAAAQEFQAIGRHDLARSEFRILLKELKLSEGQHRLKTRALYGLGRNERYSRKWDIALEKLTAAAELAKQSQDPEFQIKVLWMIGDVYRRMYHLEMALESYEKTETIPVVSTNKEDHRRRAVTKRKIASVYLFRGNGKDALKYCKDSLQIAKKAGSVEDIIKAKQHMAWSYSLIGEWNEAKELHYEAFKERESAQVEGWILAKTRRYYAEILRMIGLFDEAEEQYYKALGDLKQQGIVQEEGMIRGPVLLGLGQIARSNGNFPLANEYLRKSQEINAKGSSFFARSQSELAKLAMQLEKFDDAEKLFKEALSTYEKTNNEYYTAAMKLNLAALASQRGDPAQVLSQLEGLLADIDDKAGFVIHKIRAEKLKASAMLASGKDAAAAAEFYSSAFGSAAIDLKNQFLCNEVLASFLDDLQRLKEEQRDEEFEKLRAAAKDVYNMRADNLQITQLVNEWCAKIEGLR